MADNKKYKVGITVKEPWADNISYEQLDMTLFAVENGGDGCAYVALKPNIGVRPNQDPTTWIKATQRGQSIYDYCIEYGLFVGTEEEFAQDYADAVQAAKDAAASATHVEEEVSVAEQGRVSAENARVSAESQRASAEESRVSYEAQRSVNETGRVNAEDSRVVAENGRVVAENQRVSAESTRATNEENRRAEFGGMMRDAETAIGLVDTAMTEAENVDATVDGMIVTITDRNGVSKSVNIGFDIYRTYGSVAAMNADAANVEDGKFVMIATLDPTSTENAQLWVRNSNAATSQNPFTFLSDLDQASSAAWADWMENQKPIIEADHTRAVSDHTQAVSDHTNATNDHAVAGQDHTTAGTDHTRAESDHTTASDDHTRAESDHTTATSDHTTASSDHGIASTDHTTAQSDHTQAGDDHAIASSDHANATSDHTLAGNDHTRAESDHSTAAEDHTNATADHIRAESDHATVEVYVDSLGVFDLSKHNAVGGVLATYADLSAALTALDSLDSQYKYGGMSFKFVHSVGNKYVQYRYMGTSTAVADFTNVDNWQGVINAAIVGSKDIIDSDGVAKQSKNYGILATNGSVFKVDDVVFTSQDAVEGDTVSYDIVCTSTTQLALYNGNDELLFTRGTGINTLTIPSGFSYAKVVYSNGTVTINKLEVTNITNRGLGKRIDDLVINDCIVIASVNSSDDAKINADYVCGSGTDNPNPLKLISNVINNILPATGGKVYLRAGTYTDIDNFLVDISKNNVTIEGERDGVELVRGASGMPLQVSSSSVTGTILKNLKLLRANFNGAKVVLDNCIIGGVRKDSPSTSYEYLIAASDAKGDVKRIADFVCDGTNDESEINTAINSLPSGGCIKLSSGTFNLGSFVNINKNNISLIGNGHSTIIYRATTDSKSIFLKNNADNITIANLFISPLEREGISYTEGGKLFVYNVWTFNTHISFSEYNSPDADNTVFVPFNKGISGINKEIYNLLKNDQSGIIKLGIGTYTGSDAVYLDQYITGGIGQKYGNGITIIGSGYGTVIDRNGDNNNDVVAHSGCANILLKDFRTVSNIEIQDVGSTIIDNCWIGNNPINDRDKQNGIINVGENYYYKTLTDAYNSILNKADDEHYTINIYGHTKEPLTIPLFTLPNVDFIGHNDAVIELRVYNVIHFAFMRTAVNIFIKDIHFKKTGIGNYWNNSAVSVETENAIFENVIFENATGSPTPFNQADHPRGDESHVGGRRHGIIVPESLIGKFENLIFRNCIGIGSPYGHQNTRGWYITSGSPKLYNCIGYGGGIGEYGHGIICHRNSSPIMYNCIGYGGNMGYRDNAGLRLQCASDPTMIGCIGYGGVGYRYRSNGVPYETLHAKCQELGITDESFFYDGENVDYSAFTNIQDLSDAQKLIMALDTDDIELVPLNEISNENKGISASAGNCRGKFVNCIGYMGCGSGSIGLEVKEECIPVVNGGYFGIREFSDNVWFAKDSGQQYMTFIPESVKDNPYTILGVTVMWGVDYVIENGDRVIIETVESTPRLVTDDALTNTNILPLSVNQLNIDANVMLKVYITNGGIIKNVSGSILLKFFTCYNNSGCYALKIFGNGNPKINNSILQINNASSSIYVATPEKYTIDKCHIVAGDTTSIVQGDANPVRMFNCAIDGEVDNSVVFATVQNINNSTNYTS